MEPKTVLEILFVAFTVSKTRAGRLGSANTAALYTPVHLRFVKAKHLFVPAVAHVTEEPRDASLTAPHLSLLPSPCSGLDHSLSVQPKAPSTLKYRKATHTLASVSASAYTQAHVHTRVTLPEQHRVPEVEGPA